MPISRIVVFGDSVPWGQGLLHDQKMSSLVNQTLTGGAATCAMLAHSGAVIGVGLNPPLQKLPDDRFREVTQPYPTILQQVAAFTEHPETVDLVIINGGSNDIGFSFILNPLTDPEELKELTHLYLGEHLKILLKEVRRRFPTSKIVVVGQYPILSSESKIGLLDLFLSALCGPGRSFLDGLEVFNITRNSVKDKVVALSMLFWTESTKAIQSAIRELGDARIGGAFAPFTAAHAALTDDPWLFGVTQGFRLQPEDPVAEARRVVCDLSTSDLLKRFICHRASVGHPNIQGSRQFANAIVETVQRL